MSQPGNSAFPSSQANLNNLLSFHQLGSAQSKRLWPHSCPINLRDLVFFNLSHGRKALTTSWHERSKRVCRRASYRLRGRLLRIKISPERSNRIASAVLVLTSLLALAPSLAAQRGRIDEYRAKGNFLAAFPNFIEWPEDTFASAQTPFLLCVYGDFSFGTSLAEMTRGISIRGRRVKVRWARKEQELRACQILFVSRSQIKRYGRILKAVQGANVLTVGETPDFLASGGIINFLFEGDKLQFEVNLDAANEAKLQISSNMLVLARHVVTRAEAAKT